MQRESKQKISLWRLGLFIFGIVATIGVAVYAVSKFAGGYIPFLAPVAPWIESAVSSAAAWFQANLTLGIGMITGALTGIGGFFKLLGSVKKQGEETKAMVEEQVTATRATFSNEIASVKAESEAAIGELKGQVSTLETGKQELQTKLNTVNTEWQAKMDEAKTQYSTQLSARDIEIAKLKAENDAMRPFYVGFIETKRAENQDPNHSYT